MRIKKMISDILEKCAGDILEKTGCLGSWGEVELPECLRNMYEETEKQ